VLEVIEKQGIIVGKMDFSKNQQFLQKYISVIEKVGIPTSKNPVFVVFRYGYVQPYVGPIQGLFSGIVELICSTSTND
jgi:hypothetical protein